MEPEPPGPEPETRPASRSHPATVTASAGGAPCAPRKPTRRAHLQATLARLSCIYAPLVLVNIGDLGSEGLLGFLWLILWAPAIPGFALSFWLSGTPSNPWMEIPFFSALFLGMAIFAASTQDQLRALWFVLAMGASILSAMLWHDMLLR